MREVFRSIQTLFPYLQDYRFAVKSWETMVRRKPVENDFKAIKFFKPGLNQVFVDIGANRGLTILSMLLNRGLENKIIGFEPNPLIFEKLSKNYFIKNNGRITVHNIGLGKTNEELTLFVPFYRKWMFDGLSSFNYDDAEGWLQTRLWKFRQKHLSIKRVVCKVKKLDGYHLNPYFIKIDVQGFEFNVLMGARETIKRHQPILLIESLTDKINNFLKQYDYSAYSFNSNGLEPGTGDLNTYCMTKKHYEELSEKN
ncbi:FkbM family methyltransferase [Marivirga sp. S37H4]|uniref:FkbM family methyltransferase n=1 Tax=Marivirga aurantiaca TaxID=2802615 RepID=A0A934X1B5_9BACT|nr:FkbM family methyltransferase [Marivirga aurantiaca]MBK6266510.1 FkbM family methyltransferase [Marivirga aurantiaca]